MAFRTTKQESMACFIQFQDLRALGSSYRSAKNLNAIWPGVQLFACKMNARNMWRWDNPPARIFLVLRSSYLRINCPFLLDQVIHRRVITLTPINVIEPVVEANKSVCFIWLLLIAVMSSSKIEKHFKHYLFSICL